MDADIPENGVTFASRNTDGLRRAFDEATAPFFRFATKIPFEPLGPEFVVHLARKFGDSTRRTLDVDAAQAAFDAIGRDPQIIRDALSDMIFDRALALDAAIAQRRALMASDPNLAAEWRRLDALERAVVDQLLSPNRALTSHAALERLRLRLKSAEAPAVSTVQRALERLRRANIVDKMGRSYAIVDDQLKIWRTDNPDA